MPPVMRSSGRLRTNRGWRIRIQSGYWELEHRMVIESILGRQLRPSERVSHRNNRPENLFISSLPRSNPWIDCACGCGMRRRTFDFDNDRRPRRFVAGHNTRVSHPRWSKRRRAISEAAS
jgi:hypothetical protein